jgi:ABC-type transport system involved in cytochrome c biogenesis permease subunit
MWIGLTAGRISGPGANPDSPVRNIIYVHVPSSICALMCFVVLVIAGIGYLITSRDRWDRLAIAAAEVGTILATVLNLTGCIFTRAEWGPWWAATPRLISAAVLWFLYVVYLILRSSLTGSRQRIGRICAVFSIIAFLDVPMVIISARFMPDMHRASFDFDSPWQRLAFFLGMISIILLGTFFIWLRMSILKAKDTFEQQLIS